MERRGRKTANTIKGITIEIGGNTEPLSKALSGVNKESRSVQNELKAVEKLLKLDPSNTELVAQKQKLLADAVNAAKSKLDALKQAQAQVEEQFASGDMGEAEYRKFQREVIAAEQAVQQAEKAQGDYAEKCANAGKDAKEAGEASEKAGKKAKASGDDAKDGGSGWEKFGNLAKNAGKVAVAGVTAIAGGAAATGAAMWNMAKDTAAATDTIDKQSQAFGLSRKAYQEYDYILSQNGMDIAALTGVSKTLTAQMDKVTEGNAAATKNFEKLGVSVYDSSGKLKTQEQMLAESITALQGMEDGTEKARLATELFGRQGQTLMPLLNGEAGSVEELRQKAHDLGMVLDDEAVNAGVNFTDTLDTAKRAASGLKNSITANLLPGITQLISGFTEAISGSEGAGDAMTAGVQSMITGLHESIPRISNVLKTIIGTIVAIAPQIIAVLTSTFLGFLPSLADLVLQMVQGVLSFIESNLPLFIDAAIQIMASIIEGLGQMFPQITILIVQLVNQIVTALIHGIPVLLNGAIQFLSAIIDAIPEILSALQDNLPEIINTIIYGLLDAIPVLLDGAVQLLTAIIDAIPKIIPILASALPYIIDTIIDGLLDAIPMIIEAGIQLLTSLVSAMPEIITGIAPAVPQIISSITNALVGNIDKIITTGVQLLVALVENTPQIIVGVTKAVPKIIDGLIKAIIGFVPKLADAGLNLIKGLWNGISDARQWLWNKISGFFDGIVDKIKDFFGIHSPSTLFRDMIGKNLVKGIAVGVDVETPNLQESLENNLSAATAGLKANIEAEEMKLNVSASNATGSSGISLGGLTLHIDTFINQTDKDMEQLTEEFMYAAENYIKRRGGAFA